LRRPRYTLGEAGYGWGWGFVVVVMGWVGVAGTVGGMGVLDCPEEGDRLGGFLEDVSFS